MRVSKADLSTQIREVQAQIPDLRVTFGSDDPAGRRLYYQLWVNGADLSMQLNAAELSYQLELLQHVLHRLPGGTSPWCLVEVASGIVTDTWGVPCTVVDHDVTGDLEMDFVESQIADMSTILGIQSRPLAKMSHEERLAYHDELLGQIQELSVSLYGAR
jgi:hypothetical protein